MTTRDLIRIPGTYNFRDAGGYSADSGLLRRGKLFRSDGLHALDDEGRRMLAELGVALVIDLRDEQESAAMPDALDGLAVRRIQLPVFEGGGSGVAAGGLDGLYTRILTDHVSVVVEALRAIAASGEDAVVVHCTAGKDRTGVVVALTQLAVGVDRRSVVEDYAATEANLAGEWLEAMIAMIGRYGVPDSPQLRVLMGGSPAEALESAIDVVEREHGSVRQFLLASGLSLAELAALEDALVERD
ncbi:tyrosine-protein phosphatase [Rathayibacter sp. YIM 133350]|uniref:tyrosine-protein phosphatase n=1 Tax=Rathayibacter sp. YIM 133350 TaxID=3131992 RepID=UPI00307E60FC